MRAFDIDFDALQSPFPAADLEWKIQSCGKNSNGFWALIVPYISNRAIMDRLDTVCGPHRWRNSFHPAPSQADGMTCRIEILMGETWVAREDGTGAIHGSKGMSDADAMKGTYSTAMKRAAVQWGIGRYLYMLDAVFAKTDATKRYAFKGSTKNNEVFYWGVPPDALPKWAQEGGSGRPEGSTYHAKPFNPDDVEAPGGEEGENRHPPTSSEGRPSEDAGSRRARPRGSSDAKQDAPSDGPKTTPTDGKTSARDPHEASRREMYNKIVLGPHKGRPLSAKDENGVHYLRGHMELADDLEKARERANDPQYKEDQRHHAQMYVEAMTEELERRRLEDEERKQESKEEESRARSTRSTRSTTRRR